jgi:hypothetical protein
MKTIINRGRMRIVPARSLNGGCEVGSWKWDSGVGIGTANSIKHLTSHLSLPTFHMVRYKYNGEKRRLEAITSS